jgi:hypothetical protein
MRYGQAPYCDRDHDRGYQTVISFRGIIAGVVIGAANQSWLMVFVSSLAWGFFAWCLVASVTDTDGYKPGTKLFFKSPALTRFIAWWTAAFVTSFVVGAAIYEGRKFF